MIKKLWRKVYNLWGIIKSFYQRGRRGWADEDVWGFDNYLAKIIAEGLEELAKISHGIPTSFFSEEVRQGWERGEDNSHEDNEKAAQAHIAWLEDKISWFKWYNTYYDLPETDWTNPKFSEEEKHHMIEMHQQKLERFYNEVLSDFGQHFGELWD
jgi:hypothetical protein